MYIFFQQIDHNCLFQLYRRDQSFEINIVEIYHLKLASNSEHQLYTNEFSNTFQIL